MIEKSDFKQKNNLIIGMTGCVYRPEEISEGKGIDPAYVPLDMNTRVVLFTCTKTEDTTKNR